MDAWFLTVATGKSNSGQF